MASVCFTAAVMRVTRDEAVRSWCWIVLGASGAFLAASRTFGPFWVTIGLLLGAALLARRLPAVFRASRAPAIGVGLVLAGVVADFAWWAIVGRPRPAVPASDAFKVLLPSIDELPRVIVQQIGVFGWLDTPMGSFQYAGWIVMALALLTLAFLCSTGWQRLVALALCAGVVAATIGITAFTWVVFGLGPGGMEGRYVLPLTVMVVLLAGELVERNRARFGQLSPARLPVYVGIAAALIQASAWWLDSRRYAVGTAGPMYFLPRSAWNPPLGWTPWLFVALVGCLLLVAGAAAGNRLALTRSTRSFVDVQRVA